MSRDNLILTIIALIAIAAILYDTIEGILSLKGWHLALRITARILALITIGILWKKAKRTN